MQVIKTNTYQIQVDERLSIARKEFEYFTLYNIHDGHQLQAPMLNMALSKITDLTDNPSFQSDSYTGCLLNYFKTKRYNIQLDGELEEIEIAGVKGFFQKGFSEHVENKLPVKIHHFFINLPINEEVMLEISADCEDEMRQVYEPIFWNAIHSLSLLGNYNQFLEEQNTIFDERLKKLEDRLNDLHETHPGLLEENEVENDDYNKAKEYKKKWDSWQFDKPNEDLVKIGDFSFSFFTEGCTWSISERGNRLNFEMEVKTSEIERAKDQVLLSDWNSEDGEIKFFMQIDESCYDIDYPSVELQIENGKSTNGRNVQYLHAEGTHYELKFTGKLFIKDGYVALIGELSNEYESHRFFPVEIYKQFDPNLLDWKNYNFSMKEALLYPKPEEIYYLSVSDISVFPDEVLGFINLKRLFINGNTTNSYPIQHSSLNSLPMELEQLTELTELTIINTSITELPESIGNLKLLTYLNLSNNKLGQIPSSILQLPALNYLSLRRNQITSLPDHLNLPSLHHIDLCDNLLQTVPEEFARQPKLNRISLERNPLESLPDAMNEIEVDLNIDDKRRLLNYEYQGADGKGLVAWNNDFFFARHNQDLNQRLIEASSEGVLKTYQEEFLKVALHSVGMNVTVQDDYSEIGNTRFGGLPDLPKGADFPGWESNYNEEKNYYHYQFIAQINCAELAPFQDYLPRDGVLYFFISDQEDFKPIVQYVAADEQLISAKQIEQDQLNIFDDAGIFEPYRVEISNFVGIPHFYNDEVWYNAFDVPKLKNLEDWDHEDREVYETVSEDFVKQLGKKGKELWAGNYHVNWQHSVNDYVFTQHEQPQEQAASKLKGNPENYIVLLKVNSDVDHSCGFCFWDAGDLFFVIHKSDLAKKDFSNIYCSIETS